MKTHYETIVVGAGAAGMNCCLELQKNDREYLLISPNIGGRICNDEERHMNYGAVFYFGTYKYMLRSELLIEGPDVLPALSAGCCHHDNGKQYEPVSPTTIADAPSLLKYMKWMREEFIPRYTKFKDNCTVMEVTAALEKDPLIKQLYQESAMDMIERMGFGPIAHDLISMFAHACTGTKIKDLTALDYLNTVQPLTMKIPPLRLLFDLKRFDFDSEVFTEVDFEETHKFDEYFDEWTVIGKKYWSHALYTAAHEALPQNLAPGLIMAGDVNGLGLEPACISGIYAANKIMGKTVD